MIQGNGRKKKVRRRRNETQTWLRAAAIRENNNKIKKKLDRPGPSSIVVAAKEMGMYALYGKAVGERRGQMAAWKRFAEGIRLPACSIYFFFLPSINSPGGATRRCTQLAEGIFMKERYAGTVVEV